MATTHHIINASNYEEKYLKFVYVKLSTLSEPLLVCLTWISLTVGQLYKHVLSSWAVKFCDPRRKTMSKFRFSVPANVEIQAQLQSLSCLMDAMTTFKT